MNHSEIGHQDGHFWPLISYSFGVEGLIFMHVLTMLISIPGNLLTIIIIIKNKSLLDEAAYLLICSVSVADFLVSLVSQPLNIAVLLIGVNKISKALNLALFFCIWGFCGASAFGVVFITIDRFVYIMYPMHYSSILPRKRIYMMIGLQWSAGLAYGLLPMINIQESLFPTAVASLVTLLAMTACMTVAYNQVYRNIRRINQAEMKRSASKRKQSNATVTIALIVLIFFICWFPYIVTNFINATWDYNSESFIRALYYWFAGLGCWNSAFNVFIYGFKNSTLKYEAKKLLRLQYRIEPEFVSRTKNVAKEANGQHLNGSVYSDPSKSNMERQAIGTASKQHAYSTFKNTTPSSPLRTLQAGIKSLLKSRSYSSSKSPSKSSSPHNGNLVRNKTCVLESFSDSSIKRDSFGSENSQSTGYTSVMDTVSLGASLFDTVHSHKPQKNIATLRSSESLPDIRKSIIEEEYSTSRRQSINVCCNLNMPTYTNLAFESEEQEPLDNRVMYDSNMLEIIVHSLTLKSDRRQTEDIPCSSEPIANNELAAPDNCSHANISISDIVTGPIQTFAYEKETTIPAASQRNYETQLNSNETQNHTDSTNSNVIQNSDNQEKLSSELSNDNLETRSSSQEHKLLMSPACPLHVPHENHESPVSLVMSTIRTLNSPAGTASSSNFLSQTGAPTNPQAESSTKTVSVGQLVSPAFTTVSQTLNSPTVTSSSTSKPPVGLLESTQNLLTVPPTSTCKIIARPAEESVTVEDQMLNKSILLSNGKVSGLSAQDNEIIHEEDTQL